MGPASLCGALLELPPAALGCVVGGFVGGVAIDIGVDRVVEELFANPLGPSIRSFE